jgi:hypothetical protein
VGQARGSATRRRSFAAVIPAISIVGEDLSRNRADASAIAGRRSFTRLRNDEGMPLICPTSQIVFRCIHAAGYFAWGCFDESVSSEVVVGLKICLYWIRDSFTWPAACFAGPEVLAWGMTT